MRLGTTNQTTLAFFTWTTDVQIFQQSCLCRSQVSKSFGKAVMNAVPKGSLPVVRIKIYELRWCFEQKVFDGPQIHSTIATV